MMCFKAEENEKDGRGRGKAGEREERGERREALVVMGRVGRRKESGITGGSATYRY